MLIESARDLEAMQKVDPWPIWDFVRLGCYGFVYIYMYIRMYMHMCMYIESYIERGRGSLIQAFRM